MFKWEKPWRNLPHLAGLLLSKLKNSGLPEIDPELGARPRKSGSYDEAYPPKSPAVAEVRRARPVRLENNQIIWIQPIGWIDQEYGYTQLRVTDSFGRSSWTDAPIIAALTASEASIIESSESVRKLLPFIARVNEESPFERYEADLSEATQAFIKIFSEPEFEGISRDAASPPIQRTLEYIKDLLRYYRPGFDDLPREEQTALIEHTCRYTNDLLRAVRNLVKFAEHGTSEGRIEQARKKAMNDVRAAELKDVTNLSYLKIAEIMGIPPPRTWSSKNDHPTVRTMAKRGRELVESAFGKDGWRNWVTARREEKDRFNRLSPELRRIEIRASLIADYWGIPIDESRQTIYGHVRQKAQDLGITFEEAAPLYLEGPPLTWKG